MPSLNLDIDYFDHRDTKRLVAKLGKGSETIPWRLKCYAAKFHPETGRLEGYEPKELLMLAGISGNASSILQALTDIGFLLKIDSGYAIPNWHIEQGHLAAFSVRGKKAATARWDKIRGEKLAQQELLDASSIASEELGNAPTVLNLPTNLPTSPTPELLAAFLAVYPRKAFRKGGGERVVKIGQKGKEAAGKAMLTDPTYPWMDAARYERRKAHDGTARDLSNFLADLPVVEELQTPEPVGAPVVSRETEPELTAAQIAEAAIIWEGITGSKPLFAEAS